MTVVILLISAGILYFGRLRTLTTEEAQRPPEKTQAPGELIITYSKPSPNQKDLLRSVVLNGITVEDLIYDEIEIKGEKKSLLNLTVSFNYIGKDRTLTIPIIDSIYFRELVEEGSQDLNTVSVDYLNLAEGMIINLGLAFVPRESSAQKEDIIEFCETLSHKGCLLYVKQGFGDKPVDFGEYFEEVLGGQDSSRIDYTKVFPNIMYLLPN